MTTVLLNDEQITAHFTRDFEIHEIGAHEELRRLREEVLNQAAEIEELCRKLEVFEYDDDGSDVDEYYAGWKEI